MKPEPLECPMCGHAENPVTEIGKPTVVCSNPHCRLYTVFMPTEEVKAAEDRMERAGESAYWFGFLTGAVTVGWLWAIWYVLTHVIFSK